VSQAIKSAWCWSQPFAGIAVQPTRCWSGVIIGCAQLERSAGEPARATPDLLHPLLASARHHGGPVFGGT
jgi:hypothetical protein